MRTMRTVLAAAALALVGAWVLPLSAAFAILVGPMRRNHQGQLPSRGTTTTRSSSRRIASSLRSQVEESSTVSSTAFAFRNDPDFAIHTLTLREHRPLGCTVEESLAAEDDHAVFCASVKEGGLAQRAGLQVGDVIVGVTGLFGGGGEEESTTVDESAAGRIDVVKRLVAARPDAEPLRLRVARGTAVLARHEAALTELCADPAFGDDDGGGAAEQCMLEYLRGGYFNDDDDDDDEKEDDAAAALSLQEDDEHCNPDQDDDCVLDQMHNLWAADMPGPVKAVPSAASQDDESNNNNNTNGTPAPAKPWSSRASPSGTWVRDPATGEMRNIS